MHFTLSVVVALAVMVAATYQVHAKQLPKSLAPKYSMDMTCEPCKLFIKQADEDVEKILDFVERKMDDCCAAGFAGNMTAIDMCQKTVETMVEKAQKYVEEAGNPETMCQYMNLC